MDRRSNFVGSNGKREEIERTGEPTNVALVVAELISCSKRTLARLLVIIVSLGFGMSNHAFDTIKMRTTVVNNS